MKYILIIVLMSAHFMGDSDNAKSVSNALQAQFSESKNVKTVEIMVRAKEEQEINKEDLLKAINKDTNYDEIIVIGAGLDGIKAIDIINNQNNPKFKFIWSGHQLIKEVEDSLEKLNIVILPEYAASEDKKAGIRKQVKLIETLGVPHSTKKEDIIQAAKKWLDEDKIDKADKYLVVCLGGKVPSDQDGEHNYPATEALKLGKHLAKIAKTQKMVLLATDGPRSGREVREAFLKGVNSILSDSANPLNTYIKDKFKFIAYDDSAGSSVNPFLGLALLTKGSIAIIGGDSASLVTKAVNLLPGQVYIEENSAMTAIHKKQIGILIKNGEAKTLKYTDGGLVPYNILVDEIPNDAETAAKEIVKYEQKLN